MSNARNIASGAKFVDTAGDTITGLLTVQSNTDNTVAIGSRYTASDAQHIELTNDSHSHVGTITQADNGNTWINAAGGKELG